MSADAAKAPARHANARQGRLERQLRHQAAAQRQVALYEKRSAGRRTFKQVVVGAGLEPATRGFSIRCSTS